ncbi:MAG: phosphate starvation-inducible protein PhoH [Ruminococcaceae bacterium]|nr:phosphate starvation-inducible protein PhoH [Oscillospiraceae bacterium]
MAENNVYLSSGGITSAIFGSFDKNASLIEDAFDVRIVNRSQSDEGADCVSVSGDDAASVKDACEVIELLSRTAIDGETISEQTVEYFIGMVKDGKKAELEGFDDNCVCVTAKGRPIKPKTVGQRRYVDKIRQNTVVLGIGPAGTGKTFLAVAMAVKALRAKEISRIVLTRPAVEAGEKLGFLPGDLQNKIDPYLRPLYDALYEMLGAENYAKHLERNTIEIAPLAYMRGRTLDDSFIILDEAQNTTPEQMKMFLTRLGNNSRAVVTGDLTQTDLNIGRRSGLAEAVKILEGIEDIAVHRFTERDVVRHKLVQRIILAYEKYEKSNARQDEKKGEYRVRRGMR